MKAAQFKMLKTVNLLVIDSVLQAFAKEYPLVYAVEDGIYSGHILKVVCENSHLVELLSRLDGLTDVSLSHVTSL